MLLLRKTVIINFGAPIPSRGINVQEIVYYGFYTVIGVTTLIAVFGMCSDDGKAVGSTLTSSKLRYGFIS